MGGVSNNHGLGRAGLLPTYRINDRRMAVFPLPNEHAPYLSMIAKYFSDEDAAYQFVKSIRWPNGPICPYCWALNAAYFLEPKQGTRMTPTGRISYRRLWLSACLFYFIH